MTKDELLALIERKHDDLIEALRDADRTAYRYTTCKYSVALYPDGSTERRERLAGDNWWYQNDSAILEFGPFCYQYYDILRDNLASDELLSLLESEMNEIERTEYDRYRADFFGTEEEYPDDWDAVNWIEENLPGLWERERDAGIEELVTSQEAETEREELLDYQVTMYAEYQLATE